MRVIRTRGKIGRYTHFRTIYIKTSTSKAANLTINILCDLDFGECIKMGEKVNNPIEVGPEVSGSLD